MSDHPQTATETAMPGRVPMAEDAPSAMADGAAHATGATPLPASAEMPHPHHTVHLQGPFDTAQAMLSILVIALFVLTFLAQPYRIPSGSMENTLLVGDFLMVNKVVYSDPGPWRFLLPYRNIQRNDIIVFHYPVAPSMHLVKRVIGLPSDLVRLQAGRVLVDDRPLDEPFTIHVHGFPGAFRDDFPAQHYTDPGINTQWWAEMQRDVYHGDLVVPANMYFVLGDNRNDSLDSRYWGFVPRQNIVGQPFLVYFSLASAATSETTGMPNDGRTHEHDWWKQLAGMARWDRMFHVIR